MTTYKVTTLYYSDDGVLAYCEVRKGQSQFMALRAIYNAANRDGCWEKKVTVEEETSSE